MTDHEKLIEISRIIACLDREFMTDAELRIYSLITGHVPTVKESCQADRNSSILSEQLYADIEDDDDDDYDYQESIGSES